MKLIVGLGNPGRMYSVTRHNIGFMVVVMLAQQERIRLAKKKYHAIIGQGSVSGHAAWCALPQTYMNNSGMSLRALVDATNVALSDILVICDDIDLPLGTVRLRAQGGSGGHRGLQSINEHLHTQEYARLRIGIGRPEHEDVSDYVLRPFRRDERVQVTECIAEAVTMAISWVTDGVATTMQLYNSRG